ncbi:hypothetical protein AC579_5368 [Pseudocercospora musae]|uniref:Uncharacterized protein n=1 Tax=Pseudocercospora musae TaxID=113226 RepID=A0A139H3U0_9PEZI|nr:hypothetical protein AC579_5368 [Pseudocercospora musae]
MDRASSFAASVLAALANNKPFPTTPPPQSPQPECKVVNLPLVPAYSGLSRALAAGIIVVVTVIVTLLISGRPRTTQLVSSCIAAVVVFLVEPVFLPALDIFFRPISALLLPAIETTMACLKSMRSSTDTAQPTSPRDKQLVDRRDTVQLKQGKIKMKRKQDWTLVDRKDSDNLEQGKMQSKGEQDWTLIGSTRSKME